MVEVHVQRSAKVVSNITIDAEKLQSLVGESLQERRFLRRRSPLDVTVHLLGEDEKPPIGFRTRYFFQGSAVNWWKRKKDIYVNASAHGSAETQQKKIEKRLAKSIAVARRESRKVTPKFIREGVLFGASAALGLALGEVIFPAAGLLVGAIEGTTIPQAIVDEAILNWAGNISGFFGPYIGRAIESLPDRMIHARMAHKELRRRNIITVA